MLVKTKLFTFEFGCPVKVYKYENFTGAKTQLASLPYGKHLSKFSVANLGDKSIVLTGGMGSTKSKKNFLMDV